MTGHKSALIVLILHVVIYQVLYTVGLVWKDTPDEVVNVQQGSNITLRWHYEMEENETFLASEFVFKDSKSQAVAFRYKGESHYNPISQAIKFVISGKNDVNLTVFSVELVSSNSGYCCIVVWDSNKGRRREERCATISIYDPPRVTSHTPQLYCKQGDQVKLQCNGTGYPEPRVRWIHRDTKQIIGRSSVTSLNITGKRSEGSYCCDVKNRFGREIACTTVKVSEYKPENTTVVHWVSNNTLYIKCNAIASPPPNYFLIRINEEEHNLTNVVNTFRYISTQNNTVSCIPFNKYGQGPMKKIILPDYVTTQRNCTSECNKDINTKENNLPLIVDILCGILMAICIVVLICWKKGKGITYQEAKKKQEPTTSTSHLVQLPLSDEEEKLQTDYYIHLITGQFPGRQILLENDQGESSFSTLSSVESSLLDYHTEKLS